jgi:hypothetical protein
VTARWVVDEVAPHRDLRTIWQPISLLFKNEPDPESDYYAGALLGHRLLRVMEAVRAGVADGTIDPGDRDPVFDWYWQCGTRIHHDGERGGFDIAGALSAVGLDAALVAAADDERWDEQIRTRMDDGLALVGQDVGTPIIAFRCDDGTKRGVFGPVMTKVPGTELSLAFWDAMKVFVVTDGFWELKRTRTERPDFGPRPDV